MNDKQSIPLVSVVACIIAVSIIASAFIAMGGQETEEKEKTYTFKLDLNYYETVHTNDSVNLIFDVAEATGFYLLDGGNNVYFIEMKYKTSDELKVNANIIKNATLTYLAGGFGSETWYFHPSPDTVEDVSKVDSFYIDQTQ